MGRRRTPWCESGELRPIRNAWANDVAAGIDPPVAIPAFLMEVAYHDTAYDASLIRELDFRHEVARGIVAGVIRYLRARRRRPALPARECRAPRRQARGCCSRIRGSTPWSRRA